MNRAPIHADGAPVPNGCLWCGVDYQVHCRRYTVTGGRHGWVAPTDAQRLARLRARRAARLARTDEVVR